MYCFRKLIKTSRRVSKKNSHDVLTSALFIFRFILNICSDAKSDACSFLFGERRGFLADA